MPTATARSAEADAAQLDLALRARDSDSARIGSASVDRARRGLIVGTKPPSHNPPVLVEGRFCFF